MNWTGEKYFEGVYSSASQTEKKVPL